MSKAEPTPWPTLERADCQIEVPYCRNGRPGYRWVQGWIVRYGKDYTSIPTTLADARALLETAREDWREAK